MIQYLLKSVNMELLPLEKTNLATSHEEADKVIMQQVLHCGEENAENKIMVVVDDTDVFVLLLHYYHAMNLKNVVLMKSPIKGMTVIDICKSVQKHTDIP